MKRSLLLVLSAGLLIAAAPASTSSPPDYTDQFVDRSVDPRVDFFRFAVGKWLKDHPIPSNESSWGVGKVVQEETYQRLLALSQEASREKAAPGSNAQKIGDFWTAAMDSATNAKQGFTPLKAEFDRIAAIKDQASLLSTISHLQYMGVGTTCGISIYQDEKNSDQFAVHL